MELIGGSLTATDVLRLPFHNHVHELDSDQQNTGTSKCLDPGHRPDSPRSYRSCPSRVRRSGRSIFQSSAGLQSLVSVGAAENRPCDRACQRRDTKLPVTLDLDVGLIDTPAPANRALVMPERFRQHRKQFDGPTMHGRMIDLVQHPVNKLNI